MDGHGTTTFFGELVELVAQEGKSPRAAVTLIRPGMSSNRLKWTAPVLRKAVDDGIFNGVRMFRDHNKQQPLNRRMDELVSAVETARVGGRQEKDTKGNSLSGAVIGDVRFLNPSFASFAQEAGEFMGTSIVVAYHGERGRDKDGPYIEPREITKAISVDWVPFPAVPGTGILNFAQESFSMDWKDLTPEEFAQLQKERPELFAQEGQGTHGAQVDVAAIAAEAAKQVTGMITDAVSKAVKDTQDKIAQESEEKKATLESIDKYLSGVALPASTKTRIRAQFDGAREYKEDELKTACESATKEFEEYRKAAGITGPVIKGAGSSGMTSEGEGSPVVSPGAAMAHEATMSAFGVRVPVKSQKE